MSGILVEHADGVTTLTIDRPEKRNALTAAMYTALADALAAVEQDESVRVVLVRGRPGVFTAGNDLRDFLDEPPVGPDSPVMRFLVALAACTRPVVAAVQGPAVGVGTTMLLHCDLVYAADDATLRVPFVDLGLVPEAASSLLLPRMLGQQRAAAALLLGDAIDVRVAETAGLVNAVLPAAEVDAAALDAARRLAAKPAASVRETKRLMKAAQQAEVRERIDAEAELFGLMLGEPAARDAFARFLGREARA